MLDTLASLLEDQIKDLYSAENQLLKALPRMVKKSSSDTLQRAFESHLQETKVQVERLEQICSMLEIKPGGKKCKAMEGLLEEGKEVLEEDGSADVIDAALIAAAQRVEHYEISAYGSARTFAETLGHTDIVALLQQTLDEEKAADEKLSGICTDEVLPATIQEVGKSEKSSGDDDAQPKGAGKSGAGRTESKSAR
ncbi:MAG: ferritin-like domain-containing protein [Pyrinomonadaceae bacterium]|nr:ferritin-like domain-containing protein [Phycisphaerales bacterium]